MRNHSDVLRYHLRSLRCERVVCVYACLCACVYSCMYAYVVCVICDVCVCENMCRIPEVSVFPAITKSPRADDTTNKVS